jgi:hypothetical protein
MVMTILVDVVEPVRIAEPAHLDVAAPEVAPGSSDCTRGGEYRPPQQRFPLEWFEDVERWIVERSATVRKELAAQGATWTAPGRALEGERRPA